MITDKMDFELESVETGEVLTLKVKAMRMKDKSALDEWLRVQYMQKAMDSGSSVIEAEAQVAGLDCLSNQWFMSSEKLMARIIWQLASPKMSFNDFYEQYFDVPVGALANTEDGENTMGKRLLDNVKTIGKAIEWACRNPTRPENPKRESPANTNPQQNNGGKTN